MKRYVLARLLPRQKSENARTLARRVAYVHGVYLLSKGRAQFYRETVCTDISHKNIPSEWMLSAIIQ